MKTNKTADQRFRVIAFDNKRVQPDGSIKIISTSYRVTGTDRDGKQIRENYAALAEANKRRVALDTAYFGRETGIDLQKTRLTLDQIRIAEGVFPRLESDEEMVQAIDHWLAVGKKSQQQVDPKSLDEAFEEYRQYLDTTDEIKQRTKEDKRARANAFVRVTPNVNVGAVTPEMIDAYLGTLTGSKRNKVNHRTKLGEFFSWCCRKRWITTNPVRAADSVKIPKGSRGKPTVMDTDHCRRLLKHAVAHNNGSLAPYFAVCMFAGLRPNSEAARLTWANVNMADKEIMIDPTNKTGRQRAIEIEPTLMAWLEKYKGQPFNPPSFRDDFKAVREAAGFNTTKEPEKGRVPWVEDVLRHTAVSHFLRQHGSYGKAADYFGNSETVIRKYYKGLVSSADTEAFYKLTPKEVGRRINIPKNVIKLAAG